MVMSVTKAQDLDREALMGAPCLPRAAGPDRTPVYTSAELFCGANEIGIEHQGSRYRLKITRQGKLILNK